MSARETPPMLTVKKKIIIIFSTPFDTHSQHSRWERTQLRGRNKQREGAWTADGMSRTAKKKKNILIIHW